MAHRVLKNGGSHSKFTVDHCGIRIMHFTLQHFIECLYCIPYRVKVGYILLASQRPIPGCLASLGRCSSALGEHRSSPTPRLSQRGNKKALSPPCVARLENGASLMPDPAWPQPRPMPASLGCGIHTAEKLHSPSCNFWLRCFLPHQELEGGQGGGGENRAWLPHGSIPPSLLPRVLVGAGPGPRGREALVP